MQSQHACKVNRSPWLPACIQFKCRTAPARLFLRRAWANVIFIGTWLQCKVIAKDLKLPAPTVTDWEISVPDYRGKITKFVVLIIAAVCVFKVQLRFSMLVPSVIAWHVATGRDRHRYYVD